MPGNSLSTATLDRRGDAFSTLASRPRLEILVALLEIESRTGEWQRGPLSFSDLHAAVGIESTSQFAYHLDRLEDRFVAESREGYRLTLAGETVARAVVAGSFEPVSDLEPVTVDAPCPLCGAPDIVAETETSTFVLRCRSCEASLVTDVLLESERADRTPPEVVESVGRRLRHYCRMAADGICPECHGRLDSRVGSHERDGTTMYAFHNACQQCWRVVHVPVEVGCLVHPEATALLRRGDHPVDGPLWDLFAVAADDCSIEVTAEQPFEAVVTLACEDESRQFGVGEDFDVRVLGTDDG